MFWDLNPKGHANPKRLKVLRKRLIVVFSNKGEEGTAEAALAYASAIHPSLLSGYEKNHDFYSIMVLFLLSVFSVTLQLRTALLFNVCYAV